jgi:SH3-like domain-containing protein
MIRRLGAATLTLVMLASLAGLAIARDVINLKNGKTLSGRIIEQTDTEVRLLIDDIEIPISTENIVSIVRDGVLQPVEPDETAGEEPPSEDSDEANPPPVYRNEPTPTPSEAGMPGTPDSPGVPGEASGEDIDYPYPGREPLVPLLLPLGRFRVVTGSVVNLRSGPGTNYRALAGLPKRTLLLQLDEEDFWVRVETESGEQGWISAEYTEQADAVVAVSTGQRLNVRAGPSLQQAVIGRLDRGDLVILIEDRDGWAHIRNMEGEYGWVSTEYLEELTDLRTVRPAIAEMGTAAAETFLDQGFSAQWTGAEDDRWDYLTLTVENDTLVRNGVGVLLLLWNQEPPVDVNSTEILHGDCIVGKQTFSSSADFEDLGFSLALRDTTHTAVVAYLRGEKSGEGWKMEVNILEQALKGCRLGMVVQQGLQRGAVAAFGP